MVAVLLALAFTAAVPPAADAADPDVSARFKALFTKGEALYVAGDLGAAIWNFRQADGLLETSEVAYDLAKAYEKLGDDAYSTYYYRLYLRRAPQATDALDVAELVAEALARAEASGRGLLEMESAEVGSVVVQGKRFEELPAATFLPPGDCEVVATLRPGLVRKTAAIRTGKTTTVVLAVTPPLVTVAVEPPTPALRDLGVERRGGPWLTRERVHVGAVVGAAVGLTSLFAGIALGSMSASDVGRYRRERTQLTRREAEALAASANSKGTAANVLLIGGGLLTVAGGVTFAFTLPEPGVK